MAVSPLVVMKTAPRIGLGYDMLSANNNYLLTESEVMPGNIKRDLNVSTER